jgi:hypothetical protein
VHPVAAYTGCYVQQVKMFLTLRQFSLNFLNGIREKDQRDSHIFSLISAD